MSVSVPHRLVIADDHPLFRFALREVVTGLFERGDIAEADCFDELDLTMLGVRGFSGLIYMRAQYPRVPVVIVSANHDPAVIRRCMDFGASGFIPKTFRIDQFRKAIEVVLKGGISTSPPRATTTIRRCWRDPSQVDADTRPEPTASPTTTSILPIAEVVRS